MQIAQLPPLLNHTPTIIYLKIGSFFVFSATSVILRILIEDDLILLVIVGANYLLSFLTDRLRLGILLKLWLIKKDSLIWNHTNFESK